MARAHIEIIASTGQHMISLLDSIPQYVRHVVITLHSKSIHKHVSQSVLDGSITVSREGGLGGHSEDVTRSHLHLSCMFLY